MVCPSKCLEASIRKKQDFHFSSFRSEVKNHLLMIRPWIQPFGKQKKAIRNYSLLFKNYCIQRSSGSVLVLILCIHEHLKYIHPRKEGKKKFLKRRNDSDFPNVASHFGYDWLRHLPDHESCLLPFGKKSITQLTK